MGLPEHEAPGGQSPPASALWTTEVVALEHEGATRVASVIAIAVPLVGVRLPGGLAWGGSLHWQDLLVS